MKEVPFMWVEELSTGKFRAVERYIDPMTGKSRKTSICIDKNTRSARKAAEDILRARIEELSKPKTNETTTLEDVIEAYRADQKLTVMPSTYTRNYYAAETILALLGNDTLVSRLTAPYIRQSMIESGKEPGTLNELLKRFRALIRWGYKNDMIDSIDFLQKLDGFKERPHREAIQFKYLETDELKILLDHMAVPVWRLFTEFLALSGLRIGEAIALEPSDIDLATHQIHVSKAYDSVNKRVSSAKSLCSIRDVFIQPQLENVIRQLDTEMKRRRLRYGIRKKKLPFLFSEDGTYLKYYAFNKYFRENTEKYVGRPLTPHALRHTHASLMLEKGVPIDVISRRLGHENSRITREIYLHVTKS